MTEETLQPNKWTGKKKSGEILRFIQFMTAKNINPEDIQKDTGVSVRTVTNSIYEDNPLGAKILRQCHLNYGLSIDWVLSGVGNMFVTAESNRVSEKQGTYTSSDERLSRIANDINHWLTVASEDEAIWLETDIRLKLANNPPPLPRFKK